MIETRANIDWRLLGIAVEFFKGHGFEYVETPWIVSQLAANATKPAAARPFYVEPVGSVKIDQEKTPAGPCLVGSAEQGFLELMLHGHLPVGKYVSVSPCFRDEIETGPLHFRDFAKVELLWRGPSDPSAKNAARAAQAEIMALARSFFAIQHLDTEVQDTEIGQDLVTPQKIEVGSYGHRLVEVDENFYLWAYGTGLALPRFSQALLAQPQHTMEKRWGR